MTNKETHNNNGLDLAEEWPEVTKPRPLRTLFKQRELIASLVLRDIRTRYKQSVLGIAWALLTPIVMTLVYTLVFARNSRIPQRTAAALFYYVVMVPWTFFAQGALRRREPRDELQPITKVTSRARVLPIASILGKTVDLGLGILVLIPLFFLYRVDVTWLALWTIPILVIEFCFMLGITFVLSSVNLFYRDVRHVVPLLTHVWMYLTPIIYPISRVPERFLPVYMISNPMAPIIDSFRKTALVGEAPVYLYLGISAAVSVTLLCFGYRLFKRLEPSFAELI